MRTVLDHVNNSACYCALMQKLQDYNTRFIVRFMIANQLFLSDFGVVNVHPHSKHRSINQSKHYMRLSFLLDNNFLAKSVSPGDNLTNVLRMEIHNSQPLFPIWNYALGLKSIITFWYQFSLKLCITHEHRKRVKLPTFIYVLGTSTSNNQNFRMPAEGMSSSQNKIWNCTAQSQECCQKCQGPKYMSQHNNPHTHQHFACQFWTSFNKTGHRRCHMNFKVEVVGKAWHPDSEKKKKKKNAPDVFWKLSGTWEIYSWMPDTNEIQQNWKVDNIFLIGWKRE